MKTYLRNLFEHYPRAAAESYHSFGWRGAYLATCAFVFRSRPAAISLPRFGAIQSRAEAINLIDNFSLGELRCEEVEHHLKTLPAAMIVDVGVNIGVTSRWWLTLASTIRVTGIDMFEEALSFTSARIAEIGASDRWRPVCSAVGANDGLVTIHFTDALEGTSSVHDSLGRHERQVAVKTLDTLLSPERSDIALMKLDIEGSAGDALLGARETLARTDYVVVETHSTSETRDASRALCAAGFELFRCFGRTMWWRHPRATVAQAPTNNAGLNAR